MNLERKGCFKKKKQNRKNTRSDNKHCFRTAQESKLKANQIKLKANISFKADIKLKKSVSVVHLERSKLKPHSASRSNEEVDKLLTNYFNNNPILTRSDFQRLCGFTPTTAARHIKRLKEEKKLKNIHTYYNPIYMPMPGYYGMAEIKEDETNVIQK